MDPFTLLLLAGAALFLTRKPKAVVPQAPMPIAAPAPSAAPGLATVLAPIVIATQLVEPVLQLFSGPSAEEQAAAALVKANAVVAAADHITTGKLDSLISTVDTNVTLVRELVRLFPGFPQFGAPPEILTLLNERRLLLSSPGPISETTAALLAQLTFATQAAGNYIVAGKLDSQILTGATNSTLVRALVRIFVEFPFFGAPPPITMLLDERRKFLSQSAEAFISEEPL